MASWWNARRIAKARVRASTSLPQMLIGIGQPCSAVRAGVKTRSAPRGIRLPKWPNALHIVGSLGSILSRGGKARRADRGDSTRLQINRARSRSRRDKLLKGGGVMLSETDREKIRRTFYLYVDT